MKLKYLLLLLRRRTSELVGILKKYAIFYELNNQKSQPPCRVAFLLSVMLFVPKMGHSLWYYIYESKNEESRRICYAVKIRRTFI